jgi:hypothetical protein
VADAAYDSAVADAAADPDVVGAILVGSRAIGGPFLRDGSDWDLRLIVTDASGAATLERHATPRHMAPALRSPSSGWPRSRP